MELRPPQELFAKAIEKQVAEINAKHGRSVVFVSPVGYAVLKLREAVIDGKVPGVKKQSDLYRDLLGHGQPPILALCCYVNYATIYRRSPVGLAPFDTFNGQVPPELHKLLQEIAWQTVSNTTRAACRPSWWRGEQTRYDYECVTPWGHPVRSLRWATVIRGDRVPNTAAVSVCAKIYGNSHSFEGSSGPMPRAAILAIESGLVYPASSLLESSAHSPITDCLAKAWNRGERCLAYTTAKFEITRAVGVH